MTLLRLPVLPLLLLLLPLAAGVVFPGGTSASRWTSNMVLCYMDARSTGALGPAAEALFAWDEGKFARLLAYHDAPGYLGTGVPVDTLFDSFLFSGNTWYDGKMFWPGQGRAPMNRTDWEQFLDLILDVGAASLDAAAGSVTARLPFDQTACAADAGGGLRPPVVLAVPYPDARQQDFGSVSAAGPSLNFTRPADRLAAVSWWLDLAYAKFRARGFKRARLAGFYWFYEEIGPGDDALVPAVNRKVKAINPALMSVWIPYYRPGDPHTARWKELGFDFATLQPNYAFNNVSADVRFPAIKKLIDEAHVGVELEISPGVRNPQAGGWRGNFDTYLQTVNAWQAEAGSIMRTYYYGNMFVAEYAMGNASNFEYYTRLWNFVKGVR